MYYCLYLLSVFSSLYISIWCWFSKTSSSFCGAASAEQEKEFLIKLQEFSCLGRSSFRVWVIILMKEGNSIRKVLWDTNELARLTGNINLSPSHCLPKLLDHNPKCTMLNKYRSTLGVFSASLAQWWRLNIDLHCSTDSPDQEMSVLNAQQLCTY